MSTISQIDQKTRLPIERMKEYEVPLAVTFEEQFKNTDILVFSSTFTNINKRKAVCTVTLVGRNSVYVMQKFLKQRDYHNVEITELLTILHIIAELKEKNQDSTFRELFQIEKDKPLRVQLNINNLISKDVIKLAMETQFLRKKHDFTFLLSLLKPQMSHASLSGVEIILDYDFQYHEYTVYCNLQCHKHLSKIE